MGPRYDFCRNLSEDIFKDFPKYEIMKGTLISRLGPDVIHHWGCPLMLPVHGVQALESKFPQLKLKEIKVFENFGISLNV